MESDQKRALIAVILSGIVLFGWQKFYGPNVKPLNSVEVVKQENVINNTLKELKNSDDSNDFQKNTFNQNLEVIKLSLGETTFIFNNDLSSLSLKKDNLLFNSEEILGTNEKDKLKIIITDSAGNIVNNNPGKLLKLNSNSVSLVFDENKILNVSILENSLVNFSSNFQAKMEVSFGSKHEKLENGQIRLFKVLSDSSEKYDLSDSEMFEAKTQWFGIDFNYHLFAFSFDSKENISYKISKIENFSTITANISGLQNLNFNIVFAKKNYDELIKLGKNLDKSVDFGVLGLLAVPILRGLQFFYNVFPNYGVSIIVLTILIRLITFPLQYKSFKSMKKMSQLQPEINKLKEKYKEDPQKLQKETMELFKRSGANPLGGCLPMLLQMPVFFAFYKVLYAAVELVGQPFYFWIHDLSEKDPYFVLPVILTAAMFYQQKLTPNTSTDPTQQKVMMFMPIIFGFIMKDMPAGLVLYICVSTIFQMVQQVFVNKAA